MWLLPQVLSSLQHERIICLLGVCMVPPHICIVQELAADSLYNHLHPRAEDGNRLSHPMPYAEAREAPQGVMRITCQGCNESHTLRQGEPRRM
jgi:hypothetical protein